MNLSVDKQPILRYYKYCYIMNDVKYLNIRKHTEKKICQFQQ
jgi:hypothetical protein